MKKLLLSFFILISLNAFSQQDAWVYFNDKPDSASYFAAPLTMLSQRALDRRANQNIPLDEKDVPISQVYIDQIENAAGISVKAKSKWLNAVHVRGSVEEIQALSSLSIVDQIVFADKSLNIAGRSSNQSRISKAEKKLDTQENFNYGNSNNQIEMLNGHLLHQQGFTGTGKIIAVLDAGFPGVNTIQPFQRMNSNNKILGGYNFVQRNDNIYTANSHGTLVLSTIAGYTENQLVGTAPDASFYLFITEDSSSENPVEESLWVEAAEVADSLGVDIINSSLGYFGYDNPNYSHTYQSMNGTTAFITRGADIAFSRGMIVVNSAGNSGATSNPNISAPGDGFNVLTVGAVNSNRNYVAFSSIGPTSDGRIKPDVMAKGENAVVSDTSGVITTANGTSFSSPIIAGMVAALWEALPTKTNTEIVRLIKESSHLYTTPNPQFGYGIPDFQLALQNALEVKSLQIDTFTIYPNPAGSEVSVSFNSNYKSANFQLYNSLGQMVLNAGLTSEGAVSLENLNSGVYFYKIISDGNSQTGKLIKK